MDVNKDWDKSKTYLSPSKEQAAVFIENKWHIFHRSDVIQNIFTQQPIQDKQMDDYEFNLFRHWKNDDNQKDDYGSTIKHFQDY